ncbi:uncharacterized protein ZBIST_0521 [Zygosaccharomyces bailii]|nr:uncharacterized protein ZBIST_0521 [Zygosaccharomyces bailii]
MSTTNKQSGVSSFDLEPNPFEQSFASTKEQHPVPSNGQQSGSSYAQQEQQPQAQQNLQQRTDSRPPLNVGRSTDGKSPFFYGSQKPNILSPPLLTPGGFRRLPPLLLSPSGVPQNTSSSGSAQATIMPSAQVGNMANSTANSGNGAPNVSNATAGSKPEINRTPSFLLNLSKTGLTPNESSLRTGLTPGILPPSQSHHHYPTLPALNSVNQGSSQAKPGSSGTAGTTPAPFTPGLGSLLGFPTNASPGQSGRTSVNAENFQHVTEAAVIPHENAQTQKVASETNRLQKKLPTHTDSPTQSQTGQKRSSSYAGKTSKNSKRSQSSTPNSVENRRASRNEESQNVEEGKDINDDDQERKRKEFLERNRVAASKFRRRKKEYIKRVEMDLKFYENEYDDMSRALDKLCGIVHGSPTPVASSSLISMLESSISQNDVPSSLSLLAHMKQVVYETRYFQRNGRNPRREIEKIQETDDEDRHRTDNDSTGNIRSRNGSTAGSTDLARDKRPSSANYPGSVPASFSSTGIQYMTPVQAMSTGSMPSFAHDGSSIHGMVKSEPNISAMLPLSIMASKNPASEQDVSSTIGTANSPSDVSNGRQLIPMNDINQQVTPHNNSVPEIRHDSMADLANQPIRTEPALPKYPHTE